MVQIGATHTTSEKSPNIKHIYTGAKGTEPHSVQYGQRKSYSQLIQIHEISFHMLTQKTDEHTLYLEKTQIQPTS